MDKIKLMLKYIAPYKWSAIKSVLFNILSAIFSLFSLTLIVPFLNILFKSAEAVQAPGEFAFTIEYFDSLIKYFFSQFIAEHGAATGLLIVSCAYVIAAIFQEWIYFPGKQYDGLHKSKYCQGSEEENVSEGIEASTFVLHRCAQG